MDIGEMAKQAMAFVKTLEAKKAALGPQPFKWYPYGSLNNFIHLNNLLTGENRQLLDLIGSEPVADIGGADGEVSYFLESLGCKVHFVDYSPTNINLLEGVRTLKKAMGSSIEIHDVDLDTQFKLPQKNYSLVLFLGILYHLKNPFYVLEALAKSARYCLISTKIAQMTTDKKTVFAHLPMAWLLDEREANNDPSNYWIFSDAGLRRILKRTGWEVCDYMRAGVTKNSDPSSPDRDERAFCLVRSVVM